MPEVLLALTIIFIVVTVVGHTSWLLLAFLFRAVAGGEKTMPEEDRPATERQASPPRASRSPAAESAPADSHADSQAERLAALRGYRAVVEALFRRGWVSVERRRAMHALGRRYAETLEAEAGTGAATAAADESEEVILATAVETPAEELENRAAPVASPDGTWASIAAQSEPAHLPVATLRDDGSPARPPASLPKRAATEVLQSFLIAHNIRWGELIAGLLIVFCAIGLVISLWSPLTRTHRLLPSLVFMAGTISIEAAGLYTLRRWRLRHTSRAVLLIATLLVPLSVVAGIAVAHGGATEIRLGNPLTVGFLLFGATVYGFAIWRAGLALVQRSSAIWWTCAVAAPTAVLPMLPALTRQSTAAALAGIVASSVAVMFAIVIPAGRRGLATWHHRRGGPAIRNLVWLGGVGVYALGVLVAFVASQGERSLDVTVPLGLAILPAITAVTGLGLSFHETARQGAKQVLGLSLALIGCLVILALFPVAVGKPSWLLGWGVAVAFPAVWTSGRLGTRWLAGVAAVAVGLAAILLVPHALADEAWRYDLSLWRRPLQSAAMLTATIWGALLLGVASRVRLRREDVGRFALPLSIVGAGWLGFAMVTAIFVGCFGWWIPGEVGWLTAALILILGGCSAIAAAGWLAESTAGEGAASRSLPRRLLMLGQGALLLGSVVWIGWSVPERLFAIEAWKTGEAAWAWITILGGFALAWQGAAWGAERAIRERSARSGRLLREIPFRFDELCGVVAVSGLFGIAAFMLIRAVVSSPDAVAGRLAGFGLVPLAGLVATLGWSLVAERAGQSSWWRVTIGELRGLAVQAAGLWIVLTGLLPRLPVAEGMPPLSIWLGATGTATLALTLICLVVAWWRQSASLPEADPVVTGRWRSFAAGSVAAAAMALGILAARLLQLHGAIPGEDVTFADRLIVGLVSGWGLVIAGALAIAATVLRQRWAGYAAMGAALAASSVLVGVEADNAWEAVEWFGAACLGLVLFQRGFEAIGGIDGLRRRALVERGTPTHEMSDRAGAWPLPVRLVAWLGCGLAACLSVVAVGAVWTRPVALAGWVEATTMGYVAVAGVLVGRYGKRLGSPYRILPVHVVVIVSGILVAAITIWGGVAPTDGWRWLLAIWMGAGVGATALSQWSPQAKAYRATALTLFAALAVVGLFPRVFRDPMAWNSLGASVLGHLVLLMGVRGRHLAARRGDGPPVSQLAGGSALVFAGIGLIMLWGRVDAAGLSLSAGWAVAAIWWIAWAVVWRSLLPARPQSPSPLVDGLFGFFALPPLAVLVAFVAIYRMGRGGEETAPLAAGIACAAVLPLVGTTLFRVGRSAQGIVAYSSLLIGVVYLSCFVGPPSPMPLRVAIAAVSCAAASVLVGWAWPLRQLVRAKLCQAGFDWSLARDRRISLELLGGFLATAVITFALALGLAIEGHAPLASWLSVAAVGLCGWALATVASRRTSTPLNTFVVLLFCAVVALLAIVVREGESHRLLTSTMRLFVAGVFLVPACLWGVPRGLRLAFDAWQQPLRVGAASGLGLAVISLAGLLVLESQWRTDVDLIDAEPVLVVGVALVLAALSGLSASLAVWPRAAFVTRVLPNFSETDRRLLIYGAQLAAGLVGLHLYLCDATEFLRHYRGYWPYGVMGLAFASAAVTEWARRRHDRVLSETVRQTALFLPLIPAFGFWLAGSGGEAWTFAGGDVSYAMILMVGALFYLALAFVWRGERLPLGLAIVLGNGAIWVLLTQTPGWGFLQHPQLWLIPPAVCLLAAVEKERQKLPVPTRTALRYSATLVIYVSSTADMLLQEIGTTLWGPIVLIGLALVGVATGMVLRVQAFLALGTFFILLGVLSMVWHAQRAIDQTWPWWVFGIVSGLLLLVGLMAIEKNKAKLQAISSRLGSWD